jgi:hypothetical protein
LLGYAIGGVLLLVLIGIPVLWAVSIWMLYRIIKGWLYLYDNKPFANRAAGFEAGFERGPVLTGSAMRVAAVRFAR